VSERLSTVASDLVERIEGASEAVLRQSTGKAAQYAVEQVGLRHEIASRALATLDDHEFGESEERRAVESLVNELDERAWDIQDQVEQAQATEEQYLATFTQARAASAIWFALDEDPRKAALEAVYEAYAATGDLARLRQLVSENVGDD